MAIYKTINSKTAISTHAGLKNCLKYVLDSEKTNRELTYVTGPSPSIITPDAVFNEYLNVKNEFKKDTGRMYMHNVLSFHKNEEITPEEALDFAIEFAESAYQGYQTIIAIHIDREHIHAHMVVNTVNYIDGSKIHKSKIDLENDKKICNELCKKHELSIAEKGKHYDGTDMDFGEITAWNKNKYHLLINSEKTSYLADCGIAVLSAIEKSKSKEEFIASMQENGWTVDWSERRKHIVFSNLSGKKVRDTNLKKSFNIDATKEGLAIEFERKGAKQEKSQRLSNNRVVDQRKLSVKKSNKRTSNAII